MTRSSLLLLTCLALSLVTGCANRAGCQGDACSRAEPTPDGMVIWWPPSMRGGLGDPEHPIDHTLIRLEH